MLFPMEAELTLLKKTNKNVDRKFALYFSILQQLHWVKIYCNYNSSKQFFLAWDQIKSIHYIMLQYIYITI